MKRRAWTPEALFANTKMFGDCWEWAGKRNASGYGIVQHGGKMWGAHRLAFLLANAVHPGEKFVLHECDNPSCINPKHLRIGTARDNTLDQKQRGRGHWQQRSKTWRAWGLSVDQRNELERAIREREADAA